MPDIPDIISRRRFLRRASVSAAALGAVAAGGFPVVGSVGTADAASARSSGATDPSLLEGSGLVAHVTDAKRGEISILVGTREIRYTNREMAQQLVRAAQ